MSKTLLLLTYSFPYPPGESFIKSELPYSTEFEGQVFILPTEKTALPAVNVPNHIQMKESLCTRKPPKWLLPIKLLSVFSSKYFYKELYQNPKLLYSPQNLMWMMYFLYKTLTTAAQLNHFIESEKLNNILIYTYWFDTATYAATLAKEKHPHIKLITRAHNYDIYKELRANNYIPLRNQFTEQIDHLYSISEDGKKYLVKNGPIASKKIHVSKLGIPFHPHINQGSQDGKIRLLSCSILTRLKRPHLLPLVVKHLSLMNPHTEIEWHHIGDGPLFEDFKVQCQRECQDLPHLKIHLIGALPHDQIQTFYETHPIDCFIMTSEFEGIPVAIMEALSFGIPVVSTEVGGITEIIDPQNGTLLPVHFEPILFSNKIMETARTFSDIKKRTSIKTNLYKEFDSEKNFRTFYKELNNHVH